MHARGCCPRNRKLRRSGCAYRSESEKERESGGESFWASLSLVLSLSLHRMSQLRGDYKSVWNSLASSKRNAYLVVSGYTDEEQFHADAEDTIDILRETVGVRPDDVFLEIGCGVGRVGRVLSP